MTATSNDTATAAQLIEGAAQRLTLEWMVP